MAQTLVTMAGMEAYDACDDALHANKIEDLGLYLPQVGVRILSPSKSTKAVSHAPYPADVIIHHHQASHSQLPIPLKYKQIPPSLRLTTIPNPPFSANWLPISTGQLLQRPLIACISHETMVVICQPADYEADFGSVGAGEFYCVCLDDIWD